MQKVIVNHNGQCGDYRYEAGVPVELPEDVIAALGDNATLVDKAKKAEEKVAEKEVKEKQDTMVKKAQVTKEV